MKEETIVLKNLPKLSLNEFYAGKHWTKRKKIKDAYSLILAKYKHIFNDDSTYEVEYKFEFKSNPLDAINTTGMIKIIEDILFKDDSYKVIISVKASSKKSEVKEDKLTIIVKINN